MAGEHTAALEALQQAQRAYHRTIAGSAFASPTEGPSAIEMQKESLDAVEAARVRLDEVRGAPNRNAKAPGSVSALQHEPRCGRLKPDTTPSRRIMKLHARGRPALKSLSGWTLQGDEIRKQYTFKDFPGRSRS